VSAGSAAASTGGLVGAVVVDLEVADEVVAAENGGVAAVDDDGGLAAGPLGADADDHFVEIDRAAGADGDGV